MKIYTGNFANLKTYTKAGLFPISIALSARYYNGATYKELSPEWSYKNDPEHIYTPKFNGKLGKLNKEAVLGDLSYLSGGKDIVLLCHEKKEEFCHRQLVAKWIGGVEEFIKPQKQPMNQIMLF